MDNQILSLYAKRMTAREIAAAFKDLYDADVSPTLISKLTDAVAGGHHIIMMIIKNKVQSMMYWHNPQSTPDHRRDAMSSNIDVTNHHNRRTSL